MKIFSYGIKAILLSLAFLSAPEIALGQHFEGELRMEFHSPENGETDNLVMFVKENRLTLSGDLKSYADFPLLRDALTIRSDRNDVLIHSSDQVAVVNLRDIEMLIKQFMPNNGNQAPEIDVDIEDRARITETGERKRILGYNTRKIVVQDSENDNAETHIWVADLGINWEQLLKPMISLGKTFGGGLDVSSWDWPLSETPMLMEVYDSGELQMRAEITSITARALTQGESDIPEGKQAISLFQLMMQQN